MRRFTWTVAMVVCLLTALPLQPLVARAEDEEIEVKLFVSADIDELDFASCKVDDFGEPARLIIESRDGQYTQKITLGDGDHATLTLDSGEKSEGCYFVMPVELEQTLFYEFSLLDTELATVRFAAMSREGEVALYFPPLNTTQDTDNEGASKSIKPVEPIAYAPMAYASTQRAFFNRQAIEGEPLLLVVTSYEFDSADDASTSLQAMCDDIAAWVIETGDTALWQEVTIDADDSCVVTGSSLSSGTALVRHGDHILSFTTGGLNVDVVAWFQEFLAQYPYDPTIAIPATADIPGNWALQDQSSGDVTHVSSVSRDDRP